MPHAGSAFSAATSRWKIDRGVHFHKANKLKFKFKFKFKLNWMHASHDLGWQRALCLPQALDLTLDWYRGVEAGHDLHQKCITQLYAYRQKLE